MWPRLRLGDGGQAADAGPPELPPARVILSEQRHFGSSLPAFLLLPRAF